MASTKTLKKPQSTTSQDTHKQLILLNDKVTPIDKVVAALMDVLLMDAEQAEQCTLIAHFKGKCAVSSGPLDKLRGYKDALSHYYSIGTEITE